MNNIIKQAYSLVGAEEQRPKEWYEEVEEQVCAYCPSLTWEQRIYASAICLITGFVLSLGSTVRLLQLLRGDPEPFAIMYTLGNIVGMCSTCFLYGPWSQFKKMFAPTRLVATGAFFFFMATTLFLAFYPGTIFLRALWISLSILFQFMALVWYTLSYIPFARDVVSSCLRNTCCRSSSSSSSLSSSEDFWGNL